MKKYESYIDTDIDWIGKVPESWSVKKLKFLLKETKDSLKTGPFGSHIKNSDFIESSAHKVYTQRNVLDKEFDDGCEYISEEKYNELKGFKVFPNDILITTRGTIGRCVEFPKDGTDGVLHPCLIRVQVDESKVFRRWITKYINDSSLFFANVKYNSNSTILDVIYGYTLKEIVFPIPPIKDQQDIINYLDHKTTQIDDLISKKEKLIELLKEERTAIINQAVTKGLDPNVPMKDSGIEWLGEVPEHWEVKKLKHIFNNRNSVRVPLSAEERGKMESKVYDYYGASGVIDQVEDYLFDDENILIGEDGANLLTRSKRLAFIASGKYWVNNHAHIIKPKTGNIHFYSELLETIDYTIWVTGSAQPKLTQEALMNIQLVEPSRNEQDDIIKFLIEKLGSIDKLVSKYEKEIKLIKEYKTALISEVVTGKVDVRDEII